MGITWVPPKNIRAHVLGVFMRGEEMLACRITLHDESLKGYRAPGGGIEFGEHSTTALAREMREELGQEINIIKLLGVSENIFTYEGHPGHEISFIYLAEFTNPEVYKQEKVPYTEPGREWDYMLWVNPHTTQLPVFPDDLLDILKNI